MASTRRHAWVAPTDQNHPSPGDLGARVAAILAGAVALAVGLLVIGVGFVWAIAAIAVLAVVVVLANRAGRSRPAIAPLVSQRLVESADPLRALRDQSVAAGGGAFLGFSGGAWVGAEPEDAVMVIGPPRSGKTSEVVIPALLACPGAAVSTSTKPDVLGATLRARQAAGEVWLFDPTGQAGDGHEGVRLLSWSPVAAAGSWDEALLMARAMTLAAPSLGKGTQHEAHWSERAGALLAPLLFAASHQGETITTVLRWVLRGDLDAPARILERAEAVVACDVLLGIARTDERERSSIFSAAAGVLALYNSDAARHAARRPNFDPDEFVASTDTVFITAPAHRQALCAPLVVGLLEQIRHATYRRALTGGGVVPVFFCLDEVANIAPIHDLPALISEAGGQGLHVLACLQDLSQARTRWGEAAADGFLSLFQTKLVLGGVSDPRTLEAISVVLGEYDRPMVSRNAGTSKSHTGWGAPTTTTDSESLTYQTVRQRRVPPGQIAAIRRGCGLLIRGASSTLIRTTPYYQQAPWSTIAELPARPQSRYISDAEARHARQAA